MTAIPDLTPEQTQAIIDQALGETARKKATRVWAWMLGGPLLAVAGYFGHGELNKPARAITEHQRHYESRSQTSQGDSASLVSLAMLIVSVKNELNSIHGDISDLKDGQKQMLANQTKFGGLIDETEMGKKMKKEYQNTHPRPFLGAN